MLTAVSELLAAGTRCCVISEEQESPITVAAVMLVAQDIRDVIEASAAQLVGGVTCALHIKQELVWAKSTSAWCVLVLAQLFLTLHG